jgi:hypothetical protein
MAKVLYSRFERLAEMEYGCGKVLMVAWRKKQGDLAVPFIMQAPETHGGIPRWPVVIARPSTWREANDWWGMIEDLPRLVQLRLSWVTDTPGFVAIETTAELSVAIKAAESETFVR